MSENKLFKLLASIPVILLSLYFIPFVGVCLIGLRYFVYRNRKDYSLPIVLIVFGFVVIIPEIMEFVIEAGKLNVAPIVNQIIHIADEMELEDYSKCLLTVGIITMIVVYAVRKISAKIGKNVEQYIRAQEQAEREINEKNNLKIKEKQEAAKNTHFVKCPHCGGNNVIVGEIGKCKYCRQALQSKK
ncbi:MAG: hypothetical protein IJO08_04345 [Clostridia bacterium]|nr:hypothetical protein [Clostridia bacterium]